jgi:ferrous iron transport protein B
VKIALAGHPNCGKTSLFNALTGGKQKVGNYSGVTVDLNSGSLLGASHLELIDLPGTYSLEPRTLDERVTVLALRGELPGETRPDALLAVLDVTQLLRGISWILELRSIGLPLVVAVNFMDLAKARGMTVDLEGLGQALGVPVFGVVAVKRVGLESLTQHLREMKLSTNPATKVSSASERYERAQKLYGEFVKSPDHPLSRTDLIDRWVLHPIVGTVGLVLVLLLIFQAIFTWAELPQSWIEAGVAATQEVVRARLPEGALREFLIAGVLAGAGSVLTFLPQILILFLFILVLEDSGYMARAALLMDQWMSRVGLHGRAFIPLLSSYACAIPGIMATRTIENSRDRLTTILIAPLATCSARLPVYALLVSAFIPETQVLGPLSLQGLVMLILYFSGALLALFMAWILKGFVLKGETPALLLELPEYRWPSLSGLWIGLRDRARIFVKRAGSVILAITVILWLLASFPRGENGAAPRLIDSYAGRVGHWVEPVIKPLGFDWKVGVALIPGFAAREVMVGALATVYAMEGEDDLRAKLREEWSLPRALSLLAWYVVALQCASTVAVVRRETGGWKWPLIQLGYLTALAYGLSFLTYRIALALSS